MHELYLLFLHTLVNICHALLGTRTDCRSVRLRKVLGGGMRQPGMLAAAALFTLDNVIPQLQTDHQHAQILAKGNALG